MTTISLPTIEQIKSYISRIGRKNVRPRGNDAALYKCIMAHNCGTLEGKLARQRDARVVYQSATDADRMAFIEKVEKYL